MSDYSLDLRQLTKKVAEGCDKLKIFDKQRQLEKLQAESLTSKFWDDSENAQSIMKQIANLKEQIEPWIDLSSKVNELQELSQMNDPSLELEILKDINRLKSTYDKLKLDLAYGGKYDDYGVIMSIYAGAGGTDAQDWAQMLLRMYSRWSEQNGFEPVLLDMSSGDEAGIKSATIEISIPNAYGKLKGERGVHRLVRLSPFNADNLRQTSFAKVEVIPKISNSLEVELADKDIKIDVFRAGGHGGQSVNTTDSAVRITHLPTNISVSIQNERSQLQNKETAMMILQSRLAALKLEQHKEHINELKGPTQAVEWGSQIRNYVLHPYKQVKDLRTKQESNDPDSVLNGDIDKFIAAYNEYILGSQA